MPVEFALLLTMLALVAMLPIFQNAVVPKLSAVNEEPTKARSRSGFFDMARGVAILAVVIIHLTYLLTPYAGELSGLNNLVNNVMRFALPIFFVSSGVLLAPPEWKVGWFRSFYGRRLLALGVPYAIVTIVLSLYAGSSGQGVLYDLLTGDASEPLYFVPVLFQLYLLYPLVYRLAQKRWFVWLTLVVSIISYLVPVLRHWQDLSYATPYLFFFVWGIYMRTEFRNNTLATSLLAWLGIIGIFVGLQFYFGFERFYNGQYFYGLAVLVLLYYFYNQHFVPPKIQAACEYLGQRSLWIFLIHMPVLKVLMYSLSFVFTYSVFAGSVLFVIGGLVGGVFVGILTGYIYKTVVGFLK